MKNHAHSLRDVIADCGGVPDVAKRLRRSNQYIHEWVKKGHMPFSDLKGKTRYSEVLAEMQKEGSLTAADIRRIGFRL